MLAKHSTEQGSNGKENCGNVGFAGRRLPALANYFSKQVLDAHEGIRVMGFRGLDAKKIMLAGIKDDYNVEES